MSDVVEQYRAFVAAQPASDDGYLFDTPRCRFWPEPGDELVLAPGARAVAHAGGAAIEALGARLVLDGFSLRELHKILALFPCTYARLTLELGVRARSVVERAFSRMIFAPAPVAELESVQPACEIVRFPGSPYEVVRAYWRNACAVRERIRELAEPPTDTNQLRAIVTELHRIMLLGEVDSGERQSFYLPSSGLARKRVTPGELYDVESQVEVDGAELLITAGARVSVPLLGGAWYWQLLAESVADGEALATQRELQLDGVDIGRLVHGKSRAEESNRPWFLPPRPLGEAHWLGLLDALRVVWDVQARPNELLPALAAFHFRFVRLHPLPSANQSISMAWVNHFLRAALGMGVPHLLLDQLALRFDLPAYQRLFVRAARAWCMPVPSAAERVRNLLRLRDELNRFVSGLAGAASLIEARATLAGDGDHARAAELALLLDARADPMRIG